VVRRRGETELRVQDDESRAHARVQEAVLVARRVVCAAGEREVLAAGEAGWDGDEWDGGLFDLGWRSSAF
jgi:hypothetical protein